MGLNIFCSTSVSVYMPCCTNTNPVAFLHAVPHLCIKVHICFYIFHCQVVTGVSVPFLFSFFCPPVFSSCGLFTSFSCTSALPCSLFLDLQSRLWSIAVHWRRDAPALCAPAAPLEAVLWPWWKWRHSLSSLGPESLNSLESSTCSSSERPHPYERCGWCYGRFLCCPVPTGCAFCCMKRACFSAGRWSKRIPPYVHRRGVCDGSSPRSSSGWQRSGVLQHERLCFNGKSQQEPGTHTKTLMHICCLYAENRSLYKPAVQSAVYKHIRTVLFI